MPQRERIAGLPSPHTLMRLANAHDDLRRLSIATPASRCVQTVTLLEDLKRFLNIIWLLDEPLGIPFFS